MQRITAWVNEPRDGVYHGRRVKLESCGDNSRPVRVVWTYHLRDMDQRVEGEGESTMLEVAWYKALADLEDNLATRRAMAERRALESASSVKRAPHDSERDGRAAE